jgi:hypothetical protein
MNGSWRLKRFVLKNQASFISQRLGWKTLTNRQSSIDNIVSMCVILGAALDVYRVQSRTKIHHIDDENDNERLTKQTYMM